MSAGGITGRGVARAPNTLAAACARLARFELAAKEIPKKMPE